MAKFAAVLSETMALETVPKDLRHLRACLLCSLVKVCIGNLVVGAMGNQPGGRKVERDAGKMQDAIVYVGRNRACSVGHRRCYVPLNA